MSTQARDAAAEKARTRRGGKAATMDHGTMPEATGTIMASLAVYTKSPLTPEKHGDMGVLFSHIVFEGVDYKGEPLMTQKGAPKAVITFLVRDTNEYKDMNGNSNCPTCTVLISTKDGSWKGLPYIFTGSRTPAQPTEEGSPLEKTVTGTPVQKKTNTWAFPGVYLGKGIQDQMVSLAWEYMKTVCTTKLGMTFPAGKGQSAQFVRPKPEALDF